MTTQAMTISVVTFQRTAETRRAAPTPMIAPVMVWVVETGTPSQVAANSVIAPPVSAQKPLHRRQPRDARAHRAHDAPAAEQRAEAHRGLTRDDDPEWNVELATAVTLRIEQHRDDAHGLHRASLPPPGRASRAKPRRIAAGETIHRPRKASRARRSTTRSAPAATPGRSRASATTRSRRRSLPKPPHSLIMPAPSRTPRRCRRRRDRRSGRATSSTECRTPR